jgi:aromatic ring-opening dioxygenase catalytic subunit (LigB family)
MYETSHPAYKMLGEIGEILPMYLCYEAWADQFKGKEITTKVKPNGVVVFSAHWQAGKDAVEVNTSEEDKLIYELRQPYQLVSHTIASS